MPQLNAAVRDRENQNGFRRYPQAETAMVVEAFHIHFSILCNYRNQAPARVNRATDNRNENP